VIDPETQFYKLKEGAPDNSFSQYMTGIDNSIKSTITYNKLFFKKLNLISGLEYEYTLSIPPYANDQVLGYSAKFENDAATQIKNELTLNDQRIAGFAQLTYSPSSIFFITAGARIDYSIRNKETFNPRFSLIYSPLVNINIKLLYGTAYQAPSLFYQFEQWGALTSLMNSVSDIQKTDPTWRLENQKVATSEIIINYIFKEKFSFQISSGYSELTNLIERVIYSDSVYNKYFNNADTSIYSIGFRNENIGKQEIYYFNYKNEINLNNNLYAYFAYSYIDAISRKISGDEKIPRIANHKIWFGFVQKNIFNHLSFSVRMKIIGKINNRNKTVYPDGLQSGYENLDVSLRYSKANLTIFLTIDNLLNSEYSHGGMVDQIIYLPTSAQPGVLFNAGIEYRFLK
jgi:iron complex outermembrane receptor protein